MFSYDPTYDAWQTYLDPSHPSHVADGDAGRPIELYGVGFRNGYVGPLVIGAITAAGPPNFEENERYCEGCGAFGQAKRNIFPLDPGVPDPQGDVSNNVVRLRTAHRHRLRPVAVGDRQVDLGPRAGRRRSAGHLRRERGRDVRVRR